MTHFCKLYLILRNFKHVQDYNTECHESITHYTSPLPAMGLLPKKFHNQHTYSWQAQCLARNCMLWESQPLLTFTRT
jgi:hypothetical protein